MSTSTKTKYLSVITYCVALVCIIVGLVFPLTGFTNWDNMLVLMIPSALSMVLSTFGIDASGALNIGNDFTPEFTFTDGGANLMAFAIVLLAIIAVVGLVLLIPVFVSKRDSKVAAGCSYTIEVLAIIVLVFYALMHVYNYANGYDTNWNISLLAIALGGTTLMLVIQSIGNKGGSGVAKLVMAILGVAGAVALIDLVALISAVPENVTIGGTISVAFADGMSGLEVIKYFVSGIFAENSSYNFLYEVYQYTGPVVWVASIVLFATVVLVVVNLLIDAISLGANTSKGSTVFDIIRYLLEALAAIASVALIFVINIDGFMPGLLMYAVIVVAIVQIIISAVRCAVFKEKEDGLAYAAADVNCYDDTTPIIPVYQPAYAPVPAAAAAPVASEPAPEAAPVATQTYTVAPVPAATQMVYDGPIDAFIARLSEPEKIEFAKLFLQKINGPYANIPEYVVGGDNKEFFVSLFIYLGKFRPLISDGLMNKIYNELNLLS